MKSKVKESTDVMMWMVSKVSFWVREVTGLRLHSALLICYSLEKSCVIVMVVESCGSLTTEEWERNFGD